MKGKKTYWMQRSPKQAPLSAETKQVKQTKAKKPDICPQCDLSKIF